MLSSTSPPHPHTQCWSQPHSADQERISETREETKKKTTTTTLKWGKGVVHVCYGTCCIDDKIGTPKSYSIIYQVFSCRVDHLDVANRFTRSLNHALNHSVTQSLTLSMNHLVTRSPKHSISQRVRHSLTCSITQLLNHSLIKHSLTH